MGSTRTDAGLVARMPQIGKNIGARQKMRSSGCAARFSPARAKFPALTKSF
jgi:hypothetical protein